MGSHDRTADGTVSGSDEAILHRLGYAQVLFREMGGFAGFARDGAVPGSRIWRKVARNRVPVNAVVAIAVLSWAVMLPTTLANGVVGYLVGSSIAVIGLFLPPVSPKGVPGAADFDRNVVNYAPLTVGGALVLFGGWYLLSARTWFTGPVREAGTEEELTSIERRLEAGSA